MSEAFRFGLKELGDATDAELDAALEAVRRLEAAADSFESVTGPAFSARVMVALADDPSPAATGFLLPLRLRGFMGGFRLSVRQAWASLGAGRPPLARAAALA